MKNKYLFPGRFQPFHYGHKKIIDSFKRKYSLYPTIAIYKPRQLNKHYLFNIEEVKEIISSYFPDQKLDFIEINNLLEVFCLVRSNFIVVGNTRKKHLYKIFGNIIEMPSDGSIRASKIKRLLLENEEEVKKYVNEFTFNKLKEKKSLLLVEETKRGLPYKILNKFSKVLIYL